MKKLILFATGVGLGVYLAKQLDENPQARAAMDVATAKAKNFGAAVSEGFREREAELAKSAAKPKVASARKPVAKKTTAKQPVTKKTQTN